MNTLLELSYFDPMSLQILIPVFAALAGAGLAGFSGELRHYVEFRRERRKALNRVLWCLLDLWYEVKRADVGDGIDLVFTKLAARLGVPATAIAPPDVQAKLADILAENLIPRRNPELDRKYEIAVEELASYEPLLAYRLSGKTEIQWHREQSDAYVAAIAQQFGTNSEADAIGIGALSPFARGEVFRNAIGVIHEDIEDVAARLGRRTRNDSERVLRKLTDRLEHDHHQRVDEGVERVVGLMHTLAAQVNQQASVETGTG